MAILSLKAYAAVWEADSASSWSNRDNARQRQFGVNLIIFALTSGEIHYKAGYGYYELLV